MIENYKKLGLLGKGSHAKVYLVEDQNGHKFALKEFDNSDQSPEEMKSRFLVEKEVLQNADDAHIIQLADAWGEDDTPCLVVELCEYGSLKSQFTEIGKFSLSKAVKAGISILRGLEAMHKNGVIHRDIKPDNILQGVEGVLKVADMGLAKGTGFECTHCPQGTVAYMSPEQYSDYNNVDERSDIYSVGATLYHLYTGRELYTGKDIDDILDSHKNCIVPPLTEKRPDCPLSFNHVIRKMIAKNPADRYQNADEARLDLEAIHNGAEAINELPSILKFREFASTQISLDVKIDDAQVPDNNRKIIAIIIAVAAALLIILFVPKPEKENKENTVESGAKTITLNQEQVSAAVPEEATLPEEPINTSPLEKPKKPVKKKKPLPKTVVTYKGPIMQKLPCKLLSVSKDSLTCRLLINENGVVCSLGSSVRNVRVIELKNNTAVVDYKGSAYRISAGENHFLFNDFYRFTVNGIEIVLSTEKKTKGYTLNINSERMTVTAPDGKRFYFKYTPVDYLIPLSPLKRKTLISISRGSLVSFIEMENYYFPLNIQGIRAESVLLTDNKGYKKVHTVNDIVQNRFQVKTVTADRVSLKDIKTSKLYELEKGKQLIIRQSALISYKGIVHKVADKSTGFFGYDISIKNNRVHFIADNNSDLFISKLTERILLPSLKNIDSRHLLKNCTCYKQDLIVSKKVEKAPVKEIPKIEKEVVETPEEGNKLVRFIVSPTPPAQVIPKPNTEGIKKIRSIDLDYLVKYCDIRFMKIEANDAKNLGNFRFIEDKFLTIDKLIEIKKEDLVYDSRSLRFKNKKFIKGIDGLSVTGEDNSKYKINFIPNNYWSFKAFIKSCRGEMLQDGETSTYTFDDGFVLIKADAKRTKKSKVTFDDTNKSVSIDNRNYSIKFELGSITLTNSSGEIISIEIDQKKLMGKAWLR